MSNPRPDFRVTRLGSFAQVEALSSRAGMAPDSLFKDAEPFTQVTDRRVWTVLPMSQAPLFDRLRMAGYILAFS